MASGSTRPPADPGVFFGEPIIPVAVLTIALSTLFVGMRVWSRAAILHIFALEDWFLLLGWICASTFSVGNLVELQSGLGHMFASLTPTAVVSYLKLALSLNIAYAVALTSVKISILCLYLRALRYDYVHLATKILLVIVVITHAWIILSLFTVCVPLDAFWDASKRGSAYCHKFSVYWSHAGINITTDFLIFALPLTVLRKLRVPRRQRIALCFVFLLAFLVCVISLVRTLQFRNGITDRAAVVIGCWTMAEVNIAVICACLTTINPVLSRLFPQLLSSSPDREEEQVVDTIGHARRNRRDPLYIADTETLGQASGSYTVTGSVEMADLEAQKTQESSVAVGEIMSQGMAVASSRTTLVERAERNEAA